MRSIVLSLSFLLASTILFAQDVDTAEVVVAVDTAQFQVQEPTYYGDSAYSNYDDDDYTSTQSVEPTATQSAKVYMKEDVNVKKFDDKKWKDVVGDVTFDEEAEKKQFKDQDKKPEKKKESDFTLPTFDPGILRLISFIVVFILFAVILYFVLRNTKVSQPVKKMKPTDVSAPVENIEELDANDLLKQALASGDLRMAVRVHYLRLLKKLNEVGLIAWKKDKTNRDYLSELYGRNNCYDDVRNLTLAYEFVWYGERSVSSESFQRLSGEFESVDRQISQVEPTV
jgi:hypothetical protein